ncbi:UDP-glycosyltransferase UGT5-like isoform X27 [Planococcus citri]|uniref:UDP-glycosyltransferase UGT5-like isoform X27 n=1 Tax=Planococcus citri TaxID=170843 RepID=UPI0031FA1E67
MFEILVIFISSLVFDQIYGSQIVGLFTVPAKSHHAINYRIMDALSERDHNVTVYTIYSRRNKPSRENYREIDIWSCFEKRPHFENVAEMKHFSMFQQLSVAYEMIPKAAELRRCQPIVDLLEGSDKFDVLFIEPFDAEILSGVGYKLQIPIIYLFPNVMFPWLMHRVGAPMNPGYTAVFPFLMHDVHKTFISRLVNVVRFSASMIVYKMYLMRVCDRESRLFFGEDFPSVEEVSKNVSLVLSNTHFTYNPSLAYGPNVVQIGGVNVLPAEKLPENIEKFINESKHGVVYFCMGSLLRGETFPPEKREAFLYAFSKIPQRVLWKWEGDVLPGKSDNIMISKWMPQRDILAHPNVKLFISHGGLLGTSEAVYEGVPVLGIPIFGDQRTNIKSLEANGAGELLDYNEISKEVVLEKIQRLLNDPKYKENAKLLSDRYRDRPMSPLDTAVYWTEYVIRHKGAPHLRTAAADMPWYQYLLLDVIAFIVAVLVAGLLIIYYTTKFILRAIYGLICGGGAKKGSSKSDKKKRN